MKTGLLAKQYTFWHICDTCCSKITGILVSFTSAGLVYKKVKTEVYILISTHDNILIRYTQFCVHRYTLAHNQLSYVASIPNSHLCYLSMVPDELLLLQPNFGWWVTSIIIQYGRCNNL